MSRKLPDEEVDKLIEKWKPEDFDETGQKSKVLHIFKVDPYHGSSQVSGEGIVKKRGEK